MHPLEKKISVLLRREELILPAETVVVGVSGGPDSMALLHVLAALAPKLDFRVHGVHVDHALRSRQEAEEEQSLVAAQAETLGIGWEIHRVEVRQEAAARKISLEHAARDLRYGVLHQAARAFSSAKIAVAHTADDQAEEVLLRLVRGTARAGLSGMRTMRDGIVVRPLLSVAKSEVLAYLADRKIPYAVDSSNAERDYLRNRIRLDLLPYLRTYNANIDETLRRTAAILQDEEETLVRLTEAAWNDVAAVRREGGESAVVVDLDPFLALDLALQRRIVEKVFLELGNRPDFRRIAGVIEVARQGEGGAQLHFSKGLRMKKEGKQLLFSYPAGRVSQRGDLGRI